MNEVSGQPHDGVHRGEEITLWIPDKKYRELKKKRQKLEDEFRKEYGMTRLDFAIILLGLKDE